MFSEKYVTDVLEQLIKLFGDKYKPDAVLGNIAEEFTANHTAQEAYNALMDTVQTVYQFQCESDNTSYYGKDLFGQRACMIMDQLMDYEDTGIVMERMKELWLLEDFSFRVVENLYLTIPRDGSFIRTQNRRILDVQSELCFKEFNSLDFFEQLYSLCEDWNKNGSPVYSL